MAIRGVGVMTQVFGKRDAINTRPFSPLEPKVPFVTANICNTPVMKLVDKITYLCIEFFLKALIIIQR